MFHVRQVGSCHRNRVRFYFTRPDRMTAAHGGAQRHCSASVKQASQLHLMRRLSKLAECVLDKEKGIRQRHAISPHRIFCRQTVQPIVPPHQRFIALCAVRAKYGLFWFCLFDFATSGIDFPPEVELFRIFQRFNFRPSIREPLQSTTFQRNQSTDDPVRLFSFFANHRFRTPSQRST